MNIHIVSWDHYLRIIARTTSFIFSGSSFFPNWQLKSAFTLRSYVEMHSSQLLIYWVIMYPIYIIRTSFIILMFDSQISLVIPNEVCITLLVIYFEFPDTIMNRFHGKVFYIGNCRFNFIDYYIYSIEFYENEEKRNKIK